MTDERNLLVNIAADPEDELARMAYADLMEEQGQPERGEFIRLQCRLAEDEEVRTLPPRERLALKEREADLQEAYGAQWAGAAAEFKPEFRRGFVERVTLKVEEAEAVAQQFGALREAMPTIAGLKLRKPTLDDPPLPEQMAALLDHEACRGLRELDMDGLFSGNECARVVASAGKLALERLNLAHNELTEDGARHLAASENLGGLKELVLSHNVIGSAGLRELVVSQALAPCMTALDVNNNEIGPFIISSLRSAPWMRNVKRLDLGNNVELGNQTIELLAHDYCRLRLRELRLDGCSVGNDAMGALAGSKNFGELETLSLERNSIDNWGATGLASSVGLGKLERLNIADNQIGRHGVRALIDSEVLSDLHSLDVSQTDYTRSGRPFSVEDIAGRPGLARLYSLAIRHNGIEPEALRNFLESPHLGQLRELDLSDNPLRPDGAQALARTERLSSLRVLRLPRCRLGDEGVSALARATNLTGLSQLDILTNAQGPRRFAMSGPVSTGVGAMGKMTLGMRAQLGASDSQHVTVRE